MIAALKFDQVQGLQTRIQLHTIAATMGLLNWFKSKTRFVRCDDMYATTRGGLWKALQKTVVAPQHSNKAIWLIAHFTETFLALQAELETWHVDYEVVTLPIELNELNRSGLLQAGKVYLVLAELIQDEVALDATHSFATEMVQSESVSIAMIMVERHPLITHDQKVESFGRAMPYQVEYGFFNSLDDAVLGHVINDTLLTILKQLGLNDHELITSTLVSRRLETVLKRTSTKYRSDHAADSAREWIKLNQSSYDD